MFAHVNLGSPFLLTTLHGAVNSAIVSITTTSFVSFVQAICVTWGLMKLSEGPDNTWNNTRVHCHGIYVGISYLWQVFRWFKPQIFENTGKILILRVNSWNFTSVCNVTFQLPTVLIPFFTRLWWRQKEG